MANPGTQERICMLQLERISQSSPVFKQNISALRQRQARLADRLTVVELSDSFQCATGRDGSPVVILSNSEEQIGWMGGSSMPSVSAPAVLANFVDQGVNVAIPSIGTGYECMRLLKRVQRHCAVFVCEESTERLAAALCVIDLSKQIADGRLILLDGNVEKTLPEFINEHPGYDFPSQLITLPEFDTARFKSRTDAIHRACHLAANCHQKLADALKESIRARERTPAGKLHVAVVSVDAVGGAIDHARRVKRAADVLGWTVSISVPDHPQSCSLVSRLHAVASAPVDFVLIINGPPSRLSEYLPGNVPVVSWFLDDSRIPPVAFDGIGELSYLVAASGEVQKQLIAQGGRAERIRLIEKGVDHILFCNPAESKARGESVVVIADAENLSPKAVQIGLESHEKLWNEMQRLVAQAADRKKSMNIPDLLKKAERSTGIKLNDDDLRKQFLSMVAARIPKTIVTRAAVEAMGASGVSVDLYGRQWHSYESVGSFSRGDIPAEIGRAKRLQQANCAVFAYIDAAAIGHSLEAIAAGCLPLMRDDHEDFLVGYPAVRKVLSKVPSFGTHTELQGLIRRFNAQNNEREQLVKTLQADLLDHQKTVDRLADVAEWVCP